MGYVGLSLLVVVVLCGFDVKVFYLVFIFGIDEVLVVCNGLGINSVVDLKGKKLVIVFVFIDYY